MFLFEIMFSEYFLYQLLITCCQILLKMQIEKLELNISIYLILVLIYTKSHFKKIIDFFL